MRDTLFFLPHELFGVPLLGFGLVLVGLGVAAVGWACWMLLRKRRPDEASPVSELLSALPVWLVAAAIVSFVLPQVEQVLPNGEPIGLPIRGYGVMVLLGLLAGIGISIVRGKQLGIVPDVIIGLGFWMMLGGIAGARLFYVVQKWNENQHLDLQSRVIDIFKLTEGGLVIYGGVVGGLLACWIFCRLNRLPITATADLVAPGFLIGLSLGRIGCLLHGCCFGGVCTANLPAIHVPAGSGPYNTQLASGALLGIELQGKRSPPGTIAKIQADSLAEEAKWQPGQRLVEIDWRRSGELPASPTSPPPLRADVIVDGQRTTLLSTQLPSKSLPTHPSQIYASINALLLCLLVWHLQPLPRRDGVTFLVAIMLYALSRFLLELVRSDEAGQFGTALTIAQLIALASGLGAAMGLLVLWRRPRGRAWNWTV
ncbi:MAG: prolipoprotein diacylglyceryl transferase family protein [Aureliella sp.]